jgi:murein DD-endopeptidase MepM/ murein hydrolase activator NlpD
MGAAAASVLVSANPALANSSAASADIAAPIRAAQAAKSGALGNADEEFRNLFSSWKSLDGSGRTPLAATAQVRNPGKVSIPSLMPVDGVRLTSDFGMRFHPVLGGRRAHKGVDLAGPVGTPVRATADGVVSRADWFSSYGLYISLEHGGEIQTRYGHLSRLNVASGQAVKKGDVIGYVGSTGRSTGPHLHYEVRIAGQAVSPVPYMQGSALASAADNADSEKSGKGGPE